MNYIAQINSKNILVEVSNCYIIIDEYGSSDVQNYEVSEEEYLRYKEAPYKYNGVEEKEIEEEIEVIDYDEEGNPIGSHTEIIIKTIYVLVENPDWEEEQAQKREAEFNAEFFPTSLGYIRRAVNMSNGTKKDFLSDLLPAISMSVQTGQAVNIIAYDKPDFSEDIEDWTQYQHIEVVTPQFIQECFLTLSNDFLPINEEE